MVGLILKNQPYFLYTTSNETRQLEFSAIHLPSQLIL